MVTLDLVSKPYRYARKKNGRRRQDRTRTVSKPYRYARKVRKKYLK